MDVVSASQNLTTPLSTLLASIIRLFYVTLWREKFILWSFFRGKQNAQADLEGPFYILGAPVREIAPGKAVLATYKQMKDSHTFLFTGKITAPDGSPVVNALVDLWQADFRGTYYFKTYTLRGKVHTDSQGRFEILTVPPGEYGGRAAHFHYIITPPDNSRLSDLTTQSYVCPKNNPISMDAEFANFFRKPRHNNMIKTFALATNGDNGKTYFDLPLATAGTLDSDAEKSINQWNKLLEAQGQGDLKVSLWGHSDMTLHVQKGWL